MYKFFSFLLVVMFCILNTSLMCTVSEDENHHTTIHVLNQSDSTVYIFDDVISQGMLNHLSFSTIMHQGEGVKAFPNEWNSSAMRLYGSYYEYAFNKQYDSLWVYFLDAYTLEVESNFTNDAVRGCYVLSLNDLMSLNWKIVYPPTEEMKNVKMIPSYEEWTKSSN